MTGVRGGPTTVVKFRDVTQQADYDATHPVTAQAHQPESVGRLREQVRGQPVAIFLPPTAPQSHWECGVSLVWQLPDEEVIRLTGEPPRPGYHVFVCEHQVEID